MSLQQRISDANLRLVDRLNLLNTLMGSLTSLSTTNTSNLVAAINEVFVLASAPNGVQIDDAVTNLATTWSSTRINTAITQAVTDALEGEDLSDIAAEIASLMQADQGLVNANAAQTFTASQMEQARDNINAVDSDDVGDTDHNFLAEIDANLSF